MHIFVIFNRLFFQGSKDNMSIVLVVFPGAPRPIPEAVAAEKELDAAIERQIKGRQWI